MKKLLSMIMMFSLLCTAACAEVAPETVVGWAVTLTTGEQVQAGLPGHRWNVEKVGEHYEAIAVDENGAALFMCAFLPSGQLIYLCNLAAGDTDCLVSAEPKYERGGEEQLKYMAYALAAVQALTPDESDPIEGLELESESDMGGDHIFLNHFEAGTPGWQARRWVRLQVEPELRVTHYVDSQYFTGDDVDRLEPGMG